MTKVMTTMGWTVESKVLCCLQFDEPKVPFHYLTGNLIYYSYLLRVVFMDGSSIVRQSRVMSRERSVYSLHEST
jgi:hypothetical protein